MRNFSTKEIYDNLDYLRLFSKQYKNIHETRARIIELNASLNLPKGTEHFITDIHGENEAFEHVLRNCSGSIRRKVNETLKDRLNEEELNTIITLIYYPNKKLKLLKEEGNLTPLWYKNTLKALIEILKNVSSKSTREQVRKNIDKNYVNIIEELLYKDNSDAKRSLYFENIFDTIIDTNASDDFIIKICRSIRTLNLDHLHIIGDIYDRGRGAHKAMDIISNHHSADIQWGNHDIVWMGANYGNEACIANVMRICLRYGNIETLRDGYGIGILQLSLFAADAYKNSTKEDLKQFLPRLSDENPDIDELLMAKMQKAMAIIQFKLESQIIKAHPEYNMDNRDMLSKCDFEKGIITLDDKTYYLNTKDFPTIDKSNPTKLTKEEEKIIKTLKQSFISSEKLTEHVDTLFTKGSVYLIYNKNLLFHGCIPLNEDGTFKEVLVCDEYFKGKELLDKMELHLRTVANTNTKDTSYFWYLWCAPNSPLFGKNKMATFERYFIDDKTTHKEKYLAYFTESSKRETAEEILNEFGLNDKNSKIINGHVPIKLKDGQSPIKAEGKLLLIDGGYAKAYRSVTGIAGFTLTYNSYGMNLITHHPFNNVEYAIENEIDIRSEYRFLYDNDKRILVKDTDKAKEINKEIYYLEMLLATYQKGIIKRK
ncbi:fructose-1,6-bisphosphatase [Anaerofustis sp.]|uniref:fructose-1,6-bisphosphatase n=1 Tax=Anaerofustis sp. TaxID=1872517 RepID=UPI0025C12993|nr:fructose-1,6-bisphosphatase [Anaerofustis sp.]